MVIYQVKIADYYYVGSSKNKNKRKNKHLNDLNNKKHFNKKMQSVYEKYKQYEFSVILEVDTQDEMEKMEGEFIKIYKEKYKNKCINMTDCYGGGSNWRKYKTKEELKEHDDKRIKLSPEKRKQRNSNHSKTLQNKPPEFWEEKREKFLDTFYKNIKKRKNYTPINCEISYPNGDVIYKSFDSEGIFMNETNLEETSLRILKNTGIKIIKRRLHWTRHNFPIGTVIKLI